MSTPQSYNVDPEQLRAHASRLATHADRLASVGAALPDRMGEASLGALAQFITTGIGAAMAETMDAFAHAAATVDRVGIGMRQAADRYESSDEHHAAGLADIGTGLEGGGR
ncbi:type VII secretion target [Saccharomonospora azurea]|uniref:ESX-1 secretion-associated protein n=1 Tax=Saccharomonospora azurea NA-128 TaxID=882081 RepID=H8G708_9PSEU|nr:type VII secretion target [Saccharomonospora azurea]EHY87277.1 Protein of unknown function (DUF2580) [Saccharomonospora azurea NA-128]